MARLYILGAGFSRPAGLPLAADLLELVLDELHAIHSGPTHLHAALDTYRSFLVDTEGIAPDRIDAERFAEFLDYQHFLGLLGSDTWAEEGNRDQYLLRWGIGRVIHSLTPKVPPALYLEFAARLQPDDVVVTFNYDLLVEFSLLAHGKRYRRFPSRFSEIFTTHAVVDDESEQGEILISKLHGSIDWVSRAGFDRIQREYIDSGDRDTADFSRQRDLVFGPNSITQTRPLVEGPRPRDDPLSTIEQLSDLDAYYWTHGVSYYHPPLLLPRHAPSSSTGTRCDRSGRGWVALAGLGVV